MYWNNDIQAIIVKLCIILLSVCKELQHQDAAVSVNNEAQPEAPVYMASLCYMKVTNPDYLGRISRPGKTNVMPATW